MKKICCTPWFALLGLSLLALSWTGCTPRERAVDVAARTGILLLGNASEPQALDPHLVTGVPENRVISSLMEGLISYHPSDDNLPEPGVAESWQPNEDYSVWTFTFREDARWSNGDPVTAEDFVYSYQRMLSPTLGQNKYADMLYLLKHGEAYHQGELDDFAQVGVKALNSRTLELTLEGPVPFFTSVLKHYSWFPVHPPTIEAFGGMNNADTRWFRENYVGNGPFTLEAWEPNSILKVKKSPTYWDAERVQLEGIHFFPIENTNTEADMFRAGELHVTSTVPNQRIQPYQRQYPDLIRLEPYLGTYFYRFNLTRPPLDDLRVRKALALAIDKQQIVENITRGEQIPATGFTPPGVQGFEAFEAVHFDPDRARELLAEAGFPGGEGFPKMEILFNTQEAHKQIAEAIQNMWKVELGIDVDLFNQEWKVYIPRQQNLEYDISRSGWIGDYMDPKTFLSMWTTGNGNNNTGWSNETFDGLIAEALDEGDPERRYELLREAETIFLEEMPVAPIYWYTRIYLIDPQVGGWNPKLLDNRPYKYLYFNVEASAE